VNRILQYERHCIKSSRSQPSPSEVFKQALAIVDMSPNVKVGNYILKQKLGEGAFAEVRLGVHEDTGEEYAVKILDRSAIPRSDFEKDVKREIKIMKYLRHPGIVSIHAVLVTETKMYLVMELVHGGELYEEIVKKRRIDEETARKYFQQLVDAMVYCHRRGVVHRDLKPENLLLTRDGNLKITDFGMSWMKDKIDLENNAKRLLQTQCGTPKYMAPEVIAPSSQGYDGEKLDAWECGMVLYALLAGYLPFNGDDDSSVFHSILRGKLNFPAHFSPGAKDILTRLLEKDPDKRASLPKVREHMWFLVNYIGDASVSPKGTAKSQINHAELSISGPTNKVQDSHPPSAIAVKERLGGSFKKSRSKQRAALRSRSRGKTRSKSRTTAETLLPGEDTGINLKDIKQACCEDIDTAKNCSSNGIVDSDASVQGTALLKTESKRGESAKPGFEDRMEPQKCLDPNPAMHSAILSPVSQTIQERNNAPNLCSNSGIANVPAINLFSLDSCKGTGDPDSQPISLRDRIRSPLASIFRSMLSSQHDVEANLSTPENANVTSSWFGSPESTECETSPSQMTDEGSESGREDGGMMVDNDTSNVTTPKLHKRGFIFKKRDNAAS
jgi:serine/threonine protein kinase